MTKRRIFIDGYNVIRSNVPLKKTEETSGNAAARDELVRLVSNLAKRAPPAEWTVVFDAGGSRQMPMPSAVRIEYSGARSADEVIRELANDSVAVGIATEIVSSDQEVHIAGAQRKLAQEFYEDLIRVPTHTTDHKALASRILGELAKARHVPQGACNDLQVLTLLSRYLEYFSIGHVKPRRAALEIERLLREHTVVSPPTDSEKEVHRALKGLLEGLTKC